MVRDKQDASFQTNFFLFHFSLAYSFDCLAKGPTEMEAKEREKGNDMYTCIYIHENDRRKIDGNERERCRDTIGYVDLKVNGAK